MIGYWGVFTSSRLERSSRADHRVWMNGDGSRGSGFGPRRRVGASSGGHASRGVEGLIGVSPVVGVRRCSVFRSPDSASAWPSTASLCSRPACAGIDLRRFRWARSSWLPHTWGIRPLLVRSAIWAFTTPRTRGDRPMLLRGREVQPEGFPAHAGMFRSGSGVLRLLVGSPVGDSPMSGRRGSGSRFSSRGTG